MTPLLVAIYVAAMQNIFSKSAKYSLFDPCKEMAYIPLDEEMDNSSFRTSFPTFKAQYC
jgi:ATP:ADP antiporter, AAA family